MKVITPTELVAEAAAVVAPVRDEVVVIGAAALQIVLAADLSAMSASDETDAARSGATRDLDLVMVTPTRDVDLAVQTEQAERIVRHIEEAGLKPSDREFERGFTWVRGDLKVQLVRPFHPFPPGAARTLPEDPALTLLDMAGNTMKVAFSDAPGVPRLRSANAASLVALKENAFGRHRPNGEPVERDFHDVYLILDARADDLERAYKEGDSHVRGRVDRAVAALAEGGEATGAAARQHALITGDENVAAHETAIRRAAVFFQRRVEQDARAGNG